MTAQLISHEENKAVYTKSVEWSVFEDAVKKVYQRNRSRFQIPGFRRGKAPRRVIEMNYGEGIFYEDAINQLLPQALREAEKELDLETIGEPQIDIKTLEKGEPVVFEVTAETRPHPELGDYAGLEVQKESSEVTDEDIARRLEEEQRRNAVVETTEEPVEEGDEVVMDYAGSVDGEAFEGGTAQGQTLRIGSNAFIPGFEEKLKGHKSGESFDIDVTFPEEYHAEELAGKDAVFHIDLKEVKRTTLPALDDEFAQDVSEFDSLEEYKNSLREQLTKEKETFAKNVMENRAIEKLIEFAGFDLPQAMVDTQVEDEVRRFSQQVQQMGLNLNQYLEYTKMDMDALREQHRPAAEQRVAADLVLTALVEKENVEVSEEEVQEELKSLAERFGAKDVEDFCKRIEKDGNMKYVEEDAKRKKAVGILMDKVNWVDAPVAKNEEAEQ